MWIADLIYDILYEIGCNSSFTGSVGLIIASSRSGTCFSSCLTSSKHFSCCCLAVSKVPSAICADCHLHEWHRTQPCLAGPSSFAVRKFANKSAASAASPDSVKFQAVIKSAASAASLRGGRASGRLDHGLFLQFLGAPAPQKIVKQLRKIFFFLQNWQWVRMHQP